MNFTQQSIFDQSNPDKAPNPNDLNHALLSEIRKLGKDLSGIRQAQQTLNDRLHQMQNWRRKPFPPSVVN